MSEIFWKSCHLFESFFAVYFVGFGKKIYYELLFNGLVPSTIRSSEGSKHPAAVNGR